MKKSGIVIIVASILLIYYSVWRGGALESLYSVFLGESTIYAPKYSEKIFKNLRINTNKNIAVEKLGNPIEIRWFYLFPKKHLQIDVELKRSNISDVHIWSDGVAPAKITTEEKKTILNLKGKEVRTVVQLLGKPAEEYYYYSKQGSIYENYLQRILVFRENRLFKKIHEFYFD